MKYVVTAAQMKRYDANTIEKIGIPGMVLMERAALAVLSEAEAYAEKKDAKKSALVLAGMGNNGGDGLALARLLSEKGWRVRVWCVGAREKASEQWKQQFAILQNYPVETGSKPENEEYTVLIDALFGVGLSRELTGCFAEAVETFNRFRGYKIALDIPSGIHSDTGRVMGTAVKADLTAAFGFLKRGHFLYPGALYCGRVKDFSVGISEKSFFGEVPTAVKADLTAAFGFLKRGHFLYPGALYCGRVKDFSVGISEKSFFGEVPEMVCCDEPVKKLLPERDRAGNKSTFGKVLLAAGSVNMAGAAVLAAKAAYRTGAGMVKVITPEGNRIIVQSSVPEALFGTEKELVRSLVWADVIAAGPGLSTGESALACLKTVIYESSLPLVADADALNLLAGDEVLAEAIAAQGAEGRAVILTPHVGELSRLLSRSIAELKENLPAAAQELAEKYHAVAVVKDASSIVCDGKRFCIHPGGNSGMATAGSGDVLTGIIAALLGQGMEPFAAASAGVCLHQAAGRKAAERFGEHGMTAGDIAEAAGKIM